MCYKYKWCLSIIFLLMPMFTDVLTSSVLFVSLCFTLQFFLKEHWVCLSSAADISLYSKWYADLPGGRVEREVHHNAFPTPGDGQLATLRLKHHCWIYIFYTRQDKPCFHTDGSYIRQLNLSSFNFSLHIKIVMQPIGC